MGMGKNRKIAIFDLDFVFVNINSTFEFIEFYIYENFNPSTFIRFIFIRVVFFIGEGWLFKRDRRNVWLGFLGGEKKEKIISAAKEFVAQRMIPSVNEDIRDRFDALKRSGYFMILASASFSPVVEAFSAEMGFDCFFSSVIAFSPDGICEGIFHRDLQGRKADIIKEIEQVTGGVDYADSFFYTDNEEDLPLAKRIGNSYGVIYKNFQKIFWEENGIKTLMVDPKTIFPESLFFVPLSYALLVRHSLANKYFTVLYIGYPLFALLVCDILTFSNLLWLLAGIVGYYALYEIGYLVNDFFSIKHETSPTIRIEQGLVKYFWGYVFVRLVFFSLLATLLWIYYPDRNGLVFYLIGNIITTIIFLLHNVLPGRYRLMTYPFLEVSHFVVPLILFPAVGFWAALIPPALFYLPGQGLIYFRKLNNKLMITPDERFFKVVLPACLLFLIVAGCGIFGVVPARYVWLSAWIFSIHFFQVLKKASNAMRR